MSERLSHPPEIYCDDTGEIIFGPSDFHSLFDKRILQDLEIRLNTASLFGKTTLYRDSIIAEMRARGFFQPGLPHRDSIPPEPNIKVLRSNDLDEWVSQIPEEIAVWYMCKYITPIVSLTIDSFARRPGKMAVREMLESIPNSVTVHNGILTMAFNHGEAVRPMPGYIWANNYGPHIPYRISKITHAFVIGNMLFIN